MLPAKVMLDVLGLLLPSEAMLMSVACAAARDHVGAIACVAALGHPFEGHDRSVVHALAEDCVDVHGDHVEVHDLCCC